MSTWCLIDENLKFCPWLFIDTIYYFSLSLRIIIGVYLTFFILGGDRLPVCSRVTVFLNWYFYNTVLWWIWGLYLSFIVSSMIFLSTSDIDIIRYSSAGKFGWVFLSSTSLSWFSGTFINSPLNRKNDYHASACSGYLNTYFMSDNSQLLYTPFWSYH